MQLLQWHKRARSKHAGILLLHWKLLSSPNTVFLIFSLIECAGNSQWNTWWARFDNQPWKWRYIPHPEIVHGADLGVPLDAALWREVSITLMASDHFSFGIHDVSDHFSVCVGLSVFSELIEHTLKKYPDDKGKVIILYTITVRLNCIAVISLMHTSEVIYLCFLFLFFF